MSGFQIRVVRIWVGTFALGSFVMFFVFLPPPANSLMGADGHPVITVIEWLLFLHYSALFLRLVLGVKDRTKRVRYACMALLEMGTNLWLLSGYNEIVPSGTSAGIMFGIAHGNYLGVAAVTLYEIGICREEGDS